MLAATSLQAVRPRMGGVLRIESTATIRLPANPAAVEPTDTATVDLVRLVFETLVSVDGNGIHPRLATRWEREPQGSRWRFHLRPSVTLHDGSTLDAARAATALRASAPSWTVSSDGDAVLVTPEPPLGDLPWVLAEPRFAIAVRSASGDVVGSGPFRIRRADAGILSLIAHDDHWEGRPFVDEVRVQMGRSPGDQLADIESGRTDMASVSPIDTRRLASRGLRLSRSRPLELIALVFEPHRSSGEQAEWRRMIAASFNRRALCGGLLQGQADPANALLPDWLSGYRTESADRPPATSRAPLPSAQRDLIVRVDPADPLSQSVADRLAVDAREAGFSLKIQAPRGLAPRPDARIIRVRLSSTTPERALADLLTRLGARALDGSGATAPSPGAPLDAVRETERKILDASVVVPIAHLSDLYALSESVAWWNAAPVVATGSLDLANLWLKGRP